MKTTRLALAAIFFPGLLAHARITDHQIDIKVESSQIRLIPKKGFHLNAEGPATAAFDQLEALHKPTLKTETEFAFRIVEKTKRAKLSFYVCDDKKTVCEQHQETVSLQADGGGKASVSKTMKPPTSAQNEASKSKAFSENAKFAEINLVSSDGRPTLLIFSAPWCPACLRMQTETYPVVSVANQLKKVHFVKLNNDLPENFSLAEKFHVRAIPTLILLNASGDEVYRWLDYQPAGAFAKSLGQELKNVANTKDSLMAKAALGDADAISAAGLASFKALNFEETVRWLSLSKKASDLKYKLAAEISLALERAEKDESATVEYLRYLEKGIFLTDSKTDQTRWLVDYIEKKKEMGPLSSELQMKTEHTLNELEKALQNRSALAESFRRSTYDDYSGFEVCDVLLQKSRLYAALEQNENKAKSDQRIIKEIESKKLSVSRPGEMLMAIAYLREAGEVRRVEELYAKLIRQNPKTYVYFEKYARYLLKQKQNEKALAQADLALRFVEGNQPQLLLLKARILNEMKLKDQALATVDLALDLKDAGHAKFKKTYTQLTKLKTDLQLPPTTR